MYLPTFRTYFNFIVSTYYSWIFYLIKNFFYIYLILRSTTKYIHEKKNYITLVEFPNVTIFAAQNRLVQVLSEVSVSQVKQINLTLFWLN